MATATAPATSTTSIQNFLARTREDESKAQLWFDKISDVITTEPQVFEFRAIIYKSVFDTVVRKLGTKCQSSEYPLYVCECEGHNCKCSDETIHEWLAQNPPYVVVCEIFQGAVDTTTTEIKTETATPNQTTKNIIPPPIILRNTNRDTSAEPPQSKKQKQRQKKKQNIFLA